MSSGRAGRALLGLAALLVVAFLVFPVVVIVPISFSGSAFLTFPPESLSLQWYAKFFARADWLEATWLSLWVAGLVTLMATVLGTAAAFGVVRGRFPGQRLVVAFLLSPLIVPGIIVAIAVYFFYARLGIVGSPVAIALAHTALAVPFVVVNVSAVLHGVDRRLEQAAQNLGASAWTTFRLITFPLIRPGVLAGGLFAFIASFDELIVALFITAPGHVTLPARMWQSMRNEIDPTIAAVSSLEILLSVALFFVAARLQARAAGGGA
ncbi:ABC transporter permease (plasmid) [Paroceanicella profunda]|uniref:ABC transporter permease n=2 Tax=Paroceanicella profunda TaxID=2579971 RepID=A0A5B8G5C2_9RHOB|nr:ABC transporter permease [Paroceanicella profunda]